MTSLLELEGKIKERHARVERVMEEAGPDMDFSKVKSLEGDTTAKVGQLQTITKELDAFYKEATPLWELKKAGEAASAFRKAQAEPTFKLPQPGGAEKANGQATPVEYKSVSHALSLQPGYVNLTKGMDIEIADFNARSLVGAKALFNTITGWTPESTRGPRIVMPVELQLVVADLPFSTTTTQQLIRWMQETTTTHNATAVAEGAVKPESAYALTPKESPVQKIATSINVTEETLDDVERVEEYLNSRLTRAVAQEFDRLIVGGDGVSPNLLGVTLTPNIQTQAKGADPTFDAIHKAMTKVQVVGGKTPDAIVLHPNDWQEIKLTRTVDGIYILGNPADGGPMRLWGLGVVSTTSMTEGTGIVAAWRESSEIAMRKGLTIKTSDSHASNFISNIITIIAEMRAAFMVHSPLGFCTVTGI